MAREHVHKWKTLGLFVRWCTVCGCATTVSAGQCIHLEPKKCAFKHIDKFSFDKMSNKVKRKRSELV